MGLRIPYLTFCTSGSLSSTYFQSLCALELLFVKFSQKQIGDILRMVIHKLNFTLYLSVITLLRQVNKTLVALCFHHSTESDTMQAF